MAAFPVRALIFGKPQMLSSRQTGAGVDRACLPLGKRDLMCGPAPFPAHQFAPSGQDQGQARLHRRATLYVRVQDGGVKGGFPPTPKKKGGHLRARPLSLPSGPDQFHDLISVS